MPRQIHTVSELLYESTVDCDDDIEELVDILEELVKKKKQIRILIVENPPTDIEVAESLENIS